MIRLIVYLSFVSLSVGATFLFFDGEEPSQTAVVINEGRSTTPTVDQLPSQLYGIESSVDDQSKGTIEVLPRHEIPKIMKGMRLIVVSMSSNVDETYAIFSSPEQSFITVYVGDEVMPGIEVIDIAADFVIVLYQKVSYQIHMADRDVKGGQVETSQSAHMPPVPTNYMPLPRGGAATASHRSTMRRPGQSTTQSSAFVTTGDFVEEGKPGEPTGNIGFSGGGVSSFNITNPTSTTEKSSNSSDQSNQIEDSKTGSDREQPSFMQTTGESDDSSVPKFMVGGEVEASLEQVPVYMRE